jgi:hypothetical protein
MLKMKIAPQSLLKTKGQKSAPQELMKINKLTSFHDELMKGKEIAWFLSKDPGIVIVRRGRARFLASLRITADGLGMTAQRTGSEGETACADGQTPA